jgi:hypothetical protein
LIAIAQAAPTATSTLTRDLNQVMVGGGITVLSESQVHGESTMDYEVTSNGRRAISNLRSTAVYSQRGDGWVLKSVVPREQTITFTEPALVEF